MTAQHIVLATGLRPRYPPIPGAKEYGITRYYSINIMQLNSSGVGSQSRKRKNETNETALQVIVHVFGMSLCVFVVLCTSAPRDVA